MQTYDILMIVVLVAGLVFGAWKGLAWQLASLASLAVSYFAALRFSTPLAPYFGDQAPLNRFVAMLVIYAACSAVIWLLFRLVHGFIDRVQLKEFDRQMGALVGLAKGGLLCIAITMFAVSLTEDPYRKSIVSSRSGYYIAYVIDRAHLVMPDEIHDVLQPYMHKLDQQLDHDHWQPGHHAEGDDEEHDATSPLPAAIPSPGT